MSEKHFWTVFAAAAFIAVAAIALSGPIWMVDAALILAFVFGLPAVNMQIRRKLYKGGDGPTIFTDPGHPISHPK